MNSDANRRVRRPAGAFRGLGAVLAVAAVAAQAAPLRFEQAFGSDAVRGPLHYRAEYRAEGATHQLEAWLDRGTHLKRVTDGAVEVHAKRDPGATEYEMTVLDLRRRIATRIARSNLFRIGNFTDWSDLAQGLRHPRGEYHLARGTPPARSARPLQPCAWYDLAQQGRTTHVCWSAAARLPMLMIAEDGRTLWRITLLERGAIAPQVFVAHATGFVRNDANRDIATD